MFCIVEKNNQLAIHGIFDSEDRAIRHIAEVIPEYVARGFFMDKTLTAESFIVLKQK